MGTLGARVAAAGVALTLAALSAGCTSTEQVDPVGLRLNQPVRTEPAQAWRLVHDGEPFGYVVLFVDPERPQGAEHRFFSVRNLWQQELGSIDGLGRAWRFVPHQDEPEWLSSGTVRDGAAAILAAPAAAVLEDIPLTALGAPAPVEPG